ncbi:PIN domain-containing protein [Sinorhizobium sp. 8-89]|uniref:PIN domain-containing protein n=1 Tax=Sinorhizobium sp. 7-81 TaxID=3049087 RepID=UPI0024C4588C|nr:PIN domain-containing protein [Sinorhizobium sp. 7-81]MDK1389976.1 PIN domain-containing protein [Sinorhizobium sp. 7-81]
MDEKELPLEKQKPEVLPANVSSKVSEARRKNSDPKLPAGVDHFLLERVYREAHLVFQPTADLNPKADTVVVALDTNALLLPYLLGKGDLSALADVYAQFAREARLFLPERVAREFIKNRDRKLADMAQAIDDRVSKMSSSGAKVTPLLLEGFPEREALATAGEELDAATKKYLANLRKLSSHIKSWRGNDPVTNLYAGLFTKERMIAPSEPPDKVLEELEYGLRNKVPPGYKDSSKDDQGIGDVIIWMSLLHLGRTTKKDLIFVTGEQKADWFVRSGNHSVYPRPELVEAYRGASGGRSLRLSSLHDLLREMSAPGALVSEVEVAEVSANNAIQAATSASTGGFASLIYSAPRDFEIRQNGDRTDGFIKNDEVNLDLDAADLALHLHALNEELRHLRHQITRLTGDDLNTSLSLPWNRAAYGLRNHESALVRRISLIEQRLRDLQ